MSSPNQTFPFMEHLRRLYFGSLDYWGRVSQMGQADGLRKMERLPWGTGEEENLPDGSEDRGFQNSWINRSSEEEKSKRLYKIRGLSLTLRFSQRFIKAKRNKWTNQQPKQESNIAQNKNIWRISDKQTEEFKRNTVNWVRKAPWHQHPSRPYLLKRRWYCESDELTD